MINKKGIIVKKLSLKNIKQLKTTTKTLKANLQLFINNFVISINLKEKTTIRLLSISAMMMNAETKK